MTTSNGEQEATRLEQAVNAYIERMEHVPNELLEVPPAPGEWTLKELSAHCAEIYSYWAHQIAELRQVPGQPFGRTASDPERIAYVADHKHDPLPELIARIRLGADQAAAALRSYTDSEWRTVTGIHSARGEMDMDFISDLMIAGHAEEHLKQLNETLAQIRGQGAGGRAEAQR